MLRHSFLVLPYLCLTFPVPVCPYPCISHSSPFSLYARYLCMSVSVCLSLLVCLSLSLCLLDKCFSLWLYNTASVCVSLSLCLTLCLSVHLSVSLSHPL